MLKNKTRVLYIALLVLICLLSIIILYHAGQQEKLSQQKPANVDSFIIQGVNAEYDQTGKLKTQITSEEITHLHDEKISFLKNPRIIMYTDNNTPWHIRADQAETNKTGDQVILQDHVVIHQLPTKQTQETTITTTQLIIFPKKSIATTSQAVTISQPDVTIHGVGFDANLKTGQYKLRSQSKAIYHFSRKEKGKK